jgi:hypothetical protein
VVQTIQLALQNPPPSPSWGGTADVHRQGGGVGRDNARLQDRRTTPDSPTLTATRSFPPHKGEGRRGGEK